MARAQSSVLSTGPWYKLAVDKNGVYRIDQATFRKMGFGANSDPRKIKIYSQGAGMLPQRNEIPRIQDLKEVSIFIQGESDGVFNQQDYILFYAEGPDRVSFDPDKQIFNYEKNLYSRKNYYFITVSDTNGKRVNVSPGGGQGTIVNEFENFFYHERDLHNELKSGREWFGERFDLTTEITIKIEASNIIASTPIRIVTDVMAQAFDNSTFTVSWNGVQIGQQVVAPIPNTQYGMKGRHARDTFSTTSTAVSATNKSVQEISYRYQKASNGRSIGYLDFLLVQFRQQLRLYGNQTAFRSVKSLQNPISQFEIQADSKTLIWDITNPFDPAAQTTSFSSGALSFSTTTNILKEFIAFLPDAPAPQLISAVSNQNIRNSQTPSLIIVTHPDFRTEALHLKAHRETYSGLVTLVVTTTEVYNEFSGGKQDVTAIRDMAVFFYKKNPGVLKSLLLLGKCSYDYLDIIVDNKNFVPTYQSRNSLHPLLTYSSDDYFGFLEDAEGDWSESPADAHTMDIGVGRLPVKTTTEAKQVVDKIIRYESDRTLAGRWRKNITFIADDGDFNIHQNQADQLARYVEQNFPRFDTRKIYLDNYPQQPGAGGEISPETRSRLEKEFYDGALIINYTGHGGERIWAQERIFDEVQIQKLANHRLPLLVTATCEFGRQDDPLFPSGGELCMLRPNGGAIGLVTTARPVSSSTNFELNLAFYNALFQKENNRYLTLGEIFRRTKNTSLLGVSNRNFSLIGDPSLTLALPADDIRINSVLTANNSTVLQALSEVTVSGEVTDSQGVRNESFNGILEATLFDKESSFLTLGNENAPFSFKQWYNVLFRGKASLVNGAFQFQLVIPKNIAYAVDVGKLSLYAHATAQHIDAAGASFDFEIGATENTASTDNQSPIIQLYMNDYTFKSGGVVLPDAMLLAQLNDNSGINISGYGIGNNLVAIVDGTTVINLNDYYIADANNFKSGTVEYFFRGLSPGKHQLTLRAWDTHNNPSEASIEFIVSENEGIIVEEFFNYPNPVNTQTTFAFTHNHAGSDLDVTLAIYDSRGLLIENLQFSVIESTYQVTLFDMDRSESRFKNLNPGLYLARLIVRSLSNGSKNERVTKLIISN